MTTNFPYGAAYFSSQIAYDSESSGAIPQSVQSKLKQTVSVMDFGAIGDGVTDDTAAIQAALNSGATGVFIPPNYTFLFSTLTIPNVASFSLFGTGPSSRLKMKSGGNGIVWAGNGGSIYYMQGIIADFYIDGTNGSSNCISTAGVGGVDFNNIYIKNIPTGNDGIAVDGFNSIRTHDIRINNFRCYSSTAGRAAISFGNYASDSSVSQFIMNGNFALQYGIWYDAGANQINVNDSHPYNAAVNVVRSNGAARLFFTHCVIDNSTDNIVEINGGGHINFTACFIEGIQAGKIGINIDGSAQFVTISDTQFQGVGATSATKADATTNGIRLFGCDTSGQTWTTAFDLLGTASSEIGNLGTTPLGVSFGFSGVASSSQSQNTTVYLGVNGSQTSEGATVYVAPYDGILKTIYVAVDTTPVSGQTFVFTARINTVDVGTSATISNGQYSGTITLNTKIYKGDRIDIKSVFSATSGSSRPRYAVSCVG